MNREAGQAWFRIAIMITLLSAILVYFTEPGSAERVVSVMTLIIGLLFTGIIVVLIRRNQS